MQISEEPVALASELAAIPISFKVDRIFEVKQTDGHIQLTEAPVSNFWQKNYDGLPGEGPTRWAQNFDLTNWALFTARLQDRLIGGALIAFNTPGVVMLEGRADLAVLWDIRVHPDYRQQGVGAALLRKAETWSYRKRARQLKVETQNINVPACRFYEGNGFQLRSANRLAYPTLPDEIQLIWVKELTVGA